LRWWQVSRTEPEARLYQEWIANDRELRNIIAQMREEAAKATQLIMAELAGTSAKAQSQAQMLCNKQIPAQRVGDDQRPRLPSSTTGSARGTVTTTSAAGGAVPHRLMRAMIERAPPRRD
jgi:hypothetical protein